MSLKLDLCNFSGYKIYPSRGIRLARTDGKIYNFLNKKSRNSFMMKRNPRKISWTVLYRRKMKKGTETETTKKRTRKTTKFQRSIQGATLENILAKRNQKPEVRKAQREQMIRSQKDKVKAKKEAKTARKKTDTKAVKSKQQKVQKTNVKSRLDVTHNCFMTKIMIGLNGEKPKYKAIKKVAVFTPVWHIYGGDDYDDRIATITCSITMKFAVYFYSQPYPKRSDPTNYEGLKSRVKSKDGWMKRLEIQDEDTGEVLMVTNYMCCNVDMMVEKGVDVELMTYIAAIWISTMNNNNGGS